MADFPHEFAVKSWRTAELRQNLPLGYGLSLTRGGVSPGDPSPKKGEPQGRSGCIDQDVEGGTQAGGNEALV